MALLSNAILAVLVLTATAVLLPKLTGTLLGLIFRGVGCLIWRRTRTRREYVIARARSEEEELRAPRPKASTASLSRNGVDDEDWEKVDSSGPSGVQTATSSESSSSAGDNPSSSDTWDGIIGFFHPFWYGIRTPHVLHTVLTRTIAMLAVVVNECCGKQSAQPKGVGRRQSALSIPAITK